MLKVRTYAGGEGVLESVKVRAGGRGLKFRGFIAYILYGRPPMPSI